MTSSAVLYSIRPPAGWDRPSLDDSTPWVQVACVDYVAIPVRDLERSINFYTRVFGFRVVEDGRLDPEPYMLLHARGGPYLALHALPDRPPAGGTRIRCSFVVADLDRVRESLWNLGVPTADGSVEPRHVHRWRTTRSLLIDDPDGHRIELVESAGRGAPMLHGERAALLERRKR